MSEDRLKRLKALWKYYRDRCLKEIATKYWCRVPDSLPDDAVTLDYTLNTAAVSETIKIVVFEMKTFEKDGALYGHIVAEEYVVEGPWKCRT